MNSSIAKKNDPRTFSRGAPPGARTCRFGSFAEWAKHSGQSEKLMPLKLNLIILLFGVHSARLWAGAPPNIVMIISDDQSAKDLGFMGNRQVLTPHLDRLASQSARFLNGAVPTSVCSPSLATLLTGLYPHQSGLHYNHPPPGNGGLNRMASRAEYEAARAVSFELIRHLDTLPRVLNRDLKYRSLQTGKFWEGHYANAGFTEGMTIFEPVPGQEYGGNRVLKNGELAAHGNGDWGLKIGRETMAPISSFLDRNQQGPFLIWYAPFLPHQPHDSPERFYELYRSNSAISAHQIPYYAAISQFDETVGQLVEMIEHCGIAKQTLFVFVIDNGWEPSEAPERHRPVEFAHTKESKRSPFEPGLRTPLLLRWDGVIQPAEFQAPVSSIDVVPTIYHACGLPAAANGLPGVNLLPVAMGEATLDPHRPVFGEIYPGDATELRHPERDIAYRLIRQDQFKLILPHRHSGKTAWNGYLDGPALFDLQNDPGETTNLIDDSNYQTKRDSLESQLQSWWDGVTHRVKRPQ